MEMLFVARNACGASSIISSNVIIFCMSKNDCMLFSSKPHMLETPKMPRSLAAKSSSSRYSRGATIAFDASFIQNFCRPPSG